MGFPFCSVLFRFRTVRIDVRITPKSSRINRVLVLKRHDGLVASVGRDNRSATERRMFQIGDPKQNLADDRSAVRNMRHTLPWR